MDKSMEQQPAGENGYTFNLFGNETFQRQLLENFAGFEGEMEKAGYAALGKAEANEVFSGITEYPEAWRTSGYVASVFHPPTFLQIIAVLRDPLSKIVISSALGVFFKAAFERMAGLFGAGKTATPAVSFPVQFRPAMWLQSEQVLVTVICDLNEPADFRIAETLIPLAFERAGEWLERNGKTHTYMTYRVKDGKLNNIPTLTADEPPRH